MELALNKRSTNVVVFFAALLVAQITNLYFISTGRFELNSQFFFGLLGVNRVAIVVSLIFISLLVWALIKFGSRNFASALFLVLAGASSNLIDRFARGGVIDYFSLYFIPLFNIADIFITAGAILLFAGFVKDKIKTPS